MALVGVGYSPSLHALEVLCTKRCNLKPFDGSGFSLIYLHPILPIFSEMRCQRSHGRMSVRVLAIKTGNSNWQLNPPGRPSVLHANEDVPKSVDITDIS